MAANGQTNGTTGSHSQNIEFYAGYSRFEIELEFVQSLSNPYYLQHLASQKYLENEEFVAYLAYLQYFQDPKYLKYLQYPGPTLRALEMLQEERFRKEILIPAVVEAMVAEGFEAATSGLSR
ncbi:Mediator of RNA polymerase II transcription subunit 31 [Vermiconidia calcicola]|uniref:Mediator of RNA polymerase II transcription subunit 31 n=1 Tax=Vermiconidia calcicola TaxID=1690605 RepID=A0ACC3MXY3_9PEZI|nr:Mediator of RNA polymerase II transcription subunit 31 [Vermiconidia calcicola]